MYCGGRIPVSMRGLKAESEKPRINRVVENVLLYRCIFHHRPSNKN